MDHPTYKIAGYPSDLVRFVKSLRTLNPLLDLKSAKKLFDEMIAYPDGDYTAMVVNTFDQFADPDRWSSRVMEISDALNILNKCGVSTEKQPVAHPNDKLIELLKIAIVEATNVNQFGVAKDLIRALQKATRWMV